MRALAVALALCWAAAAQAQVARVTSGEHDGFSRLVVTLPGPADWRLLRTGEGYALDPGQAAPRYDLSDVFRLIPRSRLTAIFADPADGTLRLRIGCACHALPFELRPGIVVIDLRDGPPPPGSEFERLADGTLAPPLAGATPVAQRPRPRPAAAASAPAAPAAYDWLALTLDAGPAVLPPAPLPVPTSAEMPAVALPTAETLASGAALRDTLLRDLSRAAARGTVTLAMPAGETAAAEVVLAPPAQMRIGAPGRLDDPAEAPAIAAAGEACLRDADVDLPTWGSDKPPAEAMATMAQGVVGEFDQPDPAAAARHVRYLLHLGFGAEARAAAAAFAADAPDRPLWDTLAAILDGEAAGAGPLAGQEVCDSWAALWAVLAAPALPPGQARQDGAVQRAFSALPPHLRRHLGPGLAQRYLDAGLPGPARTIRDAIRRAPGEAGPGTDLLDAALGEARVDLHDLAAAPGKVGVDATVAALTAAAEKGAVPVPDILAAEALQRIHRGTPQAAALGQALALARASQDDFAGAFAGLDPDAPEARPVWQMLADRGSDRAVLDHAFPRTLPPLDGAIRLQMARRLVDLGLAEAALRWLPSPEEPGAALVGAEAELLRGDARAALALLQGQTGPEAEALAGRAARQLAPGGAGAYGPAAAAIAARDWDWLASEGPDPWRAAADRREVPPTDAPGPLAAGRALVAESAAARADLAALLAARPVAEAGHGAEDGANH
jgi:hypothetical protein